MRVSATTKKILDDQIQQINTAPDAVVYLTTTGVEYYTRGCLTVDMLRDLRKAGRDNNTIDGPAYIQTGKSNIVYRKCDIDEYLSKRRVQHNADILAVLENSMTPGEIEKAAKAERLLKDLFAK